MTIVLKRRTVIRLISFALFLIIIPTAFAFSYQSRAQTAERILKYSYMKNAEELLMYSENISADLKKALCSNSPPMLNRISSKLWRETGFAKETLDSLPIDGGTLEKTNKFLSQTGDFSVSLARKFSKGEQITEEERAALKKLCDYSDVMLEEVLVLNDYLMTGSVSMVNEAAPNENAPDVAEGFSEMSEDFSAYPTLIYDGPFSDHILERAPLYNKEMQNISRGEAKKRAAGFLGIETNALSDCGDEESALPSYCFKTNDVDIAVTKQGGLVLYVLNHRRLNEKAISETEALAYIGEYIKQLDLPLKLTYYEINDGTLTASLAKTENGATLYTDLVKLTVALDNGEIINLDSRGYIINSHERDNLAPKLSEAQARQKLSPYLKPDKGNLALIPTEGMGETLCYEFKCKASEGETVLVYLNAETGEEEQILILMSGEYGKLTI